MDLMTLCGMIIGGGSVYYVMVQGNIVNLLLDLDAAILVFGGTLGAALITYPWRIVKIIPHAISMMIFPPKRITNDAAVKIIISLAEKSKREGIEKLQDDIPKLETPFLRDALQLVVDGLETDIIKEKLEKELSLVRQRHHQVSSIFRSMGAYSPIFGLLGTLIGVVQVLRNLSDAQSMGAAMAIAVTTTFYGIFGANFIFLPIAGKLTIYSEDEITLKELLARGVLSIQKGDVPVLIQTKLEAFLAYKLRGKEAAKGGK